MNESDVEAQDAAKIHALLEAKRFDSALRLLAPLLADSPDNVALWQLTAIAHYGADRYPDAAEAATRAIGLRPDDPDLHLLLGQTLIASGHMGEGVGAAMRALELNPNRADAHITIALALAHTDHSRDRAVWHATRARDLEPDSASAHHAVGAALMIGRTRRAAKQSDGPLNEALRIDPQLSDAWNSLAVAHIRRGRSVRAIRACVTALQLDPQSEIAAHNLPLAVWLLVFSGRWWVLGFLLVTVPTAIVALGSDTLVIGLIVRLVGAIAIAAATWWLLWFRLLRVFPIDMRSAAMAVLRRDRLVRPVWLGQAWAAAWQFIMIVVPWWNPGMIGTCVWVSALGVWISTLVSGGRLKNARKQLQRERFEAWWKVAAPTRAPS
ncbi:MAG TPA: tetratricopeptide repeat protein [Mycobacteriales bacterium]|nr:tetratricopeptide repeat protein [Mycobacteriales bacterium]